MATHYVAMAGLHGCIPNVSELCETYEAAVESMAALHELGRDRRRQLKRDSYLELNLRRDGNEYIEIQECDCDTPDEHDDML